MAYRIHPANESPETVLDPSRAIGWSVDGEEHPGGVAACWSLRSLARYIRDHDMTVADDDQLISVEGPRTAPGHDDTDVFVWAERFEVIGTGREFVVAAAAARIYDALADDLTGADEDEAREMVEDETDDAAVVETVMALAGNLPETTTSDLALQIWR